MYQIFKEPKMKDNFSSLPSFILKLGMEIRKEYPSFRGVLILSEYGETDDVLKMPLPIVGKGYISISFQGLKKKSRKKAKPVQK